MNDQASVSFALHTSTPRLGGRNCDQGPYHRSHRHHGTHPVKFQSKSRSVARSLFSPRQAPLSSRLRSAVLLSLGTWGSLRGACTRRKPSTTSPTSSLPPRTRVVESEARTPPTHHWAPCYQLAATATATAGSSQPAKTSVQYLRGIGMEHNCKP